MKATLLPYGKLVGAEQGIRIVDDAEGNRERAAIHLTEARSLNVDAVCVPHSTSQITSPVSIGLDGSRGQML